MAVTTGNEYDHIDFTKNNITTRHPLKDATSRQMVSDIVKIQDNAPQLQHNKIWIKETPEAETIVPTYAEFQALDGEVSEVKSAINDIQKNTITKNVSGAIASFSDGAGGYPVADMKVSIEPVQSGSGTPSASNVRLIAGWTGCNICVQSKNVLPNTLANQDGTGNNPDGYTHVGSTSIATRTGGTGNQMQLKYKMHLKAGVTYSLLSKKMKISFKDGSDDVTLTSPYSGAVSVSWKLNNASVSTVSTVTPTVSGEYELTFGIYYGWKSLTRVEIEEMRVVRDNSAWSENKPEKAYAISWESTAGTVYGGIFDPTTGLLTATMANIASYNGETLPGKWISDRDVYAEGTTPTTGAQVVYELSNPQVYSLLPTDVYELDGNNDIWADTGDSDVTYRINISSFADGMDDLIDALSDKVDDFEDDISDIHYYQINNDAKRKILPSHINRIIEYDWGLESGNIDSSGAEIDAPGYFRTDFIPIEGGKEYSLVALSDGSSFGNTFYYDGDKTFISLAYGSASISYQNDGYVRFARMESYDEDKNIEFLNTYFFGLKKNFNTTDDMNAPGILASDYAFVEANRITENAKFGRKFIDKITDIETLTSIIENNNTNIYDLSKLISGYSVDEYGNITVNQQNHRAMVAMPILPSTKYTLSQFGSWGFTHPCWLDSTAENVISMISGTTGDPVTVTSPSNAYYLRFETQPAGTSQSDTQMIVLGETLPSQFIPYSSGNLQIKKTLLPGGKGNKDWSGLKYIAIGDSRTYGYNSKTDGTVTWDDDESGENNYADMIGYYTGITVENRSIPGGAYANRTAQGHADISFDYFTDNLPSDADIITVFLGTNDRVIDSDPAVYNPTEYRDDENDPLNAETFKGAIRNGIVKIRTAMPEVPIILIVDDIGFNATAADGGTTRKDMIKEVAREAGLPVFDLALGGMNQDTLNNIAYDGTHNKNWFHTDGLHESIRGQKMIAMALAGEMAKYLW